MVNKKTKKKLSAFIISGKGPRGGERKRLIISRLSPLKIKKEVLIAAKKEKISSINIKTVPLDKTKKIIGRRKRRAIRIPGIKRGSTIGVNLIGIRKRGSAIRVNLRGRR